MKNGAYWKKRAAKRMYVYQKSADAAADEIAKAYIDATNYINSEMTAIFRTFTVDGGLTEKEAIKLLNNLPDNVTVDSLKKVAGSITDPEKRRKINSIISSPAYAYRIRRFEQLQKDIDVQTLNIASFEQNASKAHYVDLANEAYNRTIFDIQKGTEIGFSFARMPVSRIEEILAHNWSGKLFSERIWGRANDINAKLKQELLVQFMTGRSYRKTAKSIEELMSVGAMEARRLVRTETTYIANSAEIEAYKESGISKFKFVATLDMRTSAVCAAMDGKEFEVSKAAPGVNVPPLHPWCRSTTVAVIYGAVTDKMTRRARDPVTGKTYLVPDDMTYEQWQQSVDDKYGAGTWEKERKMLLNRASDMEQFKRYKTVLGKENMPKTFDKFRDMKYNNSVEWNMLKSYKRAIQTGELTHLADFELYKNISKEIDKTLVGITTQNGIVITGKSNHFIARTIGSVEQRRNGVEIDVSLKTLINPKRVDDKVNNNNGVSQRFIGDSAAVTVNPVTGNLIQVNPLKQR